MIREIMATARNGSYSGLYYNFLTNTANYFAIKIGYLQIQFLASALGIYVHQHAEFSYDNFYQLTVEPCFGSGKEIHCHIMWIRCKAESSMMNHIVPLFPGDTVSAPCKSHTIKSG